MSLSDRRKQTESKDTSNTQLCPAGGTAAVLGVTVTLLNGRNNYSLCCGGGGGDF